MAVSFYFNFRINIQQDGLLSDTIFYKTVVTFMSSVTGQNNVYKQQWCRIGASAV